MGIIKNFFSGSKRTAERIAETIFAGIEDNFLEWFEAEISNYDDPDFVEVFSRVYDPEMRFNGRNEGRKIESFEYIVGFGSWKFKLAVLFRQTPESPNKPTIFVAMIPFRSKVEVRDLKPFLDENKITEAKGWKIFSESKVGISTLKGIRKDLAEEFRDFD